MTLEEAGEQVARYLAEERGPQHRRALEVGYNGS